MKDDKECEEHDCEALHASPQYCHWHPDECIGKPWKKKGGARYPIRGGEKT